MHLTHLRLFVYIEIEVTGFNSMYPYSTDFVRAIASLHYQQVAKELMDAVPSLQYVFLSAGSQYEVWRGELHDPVKRGRWLVHSAWKNELLPSKTPKELDEDVMERKLLEEDLFLSAQDNVGHCACAPTYELTRLCARSCWGSIELTARTKPHHGPSEQYTFIRMNQFGDTSTSRQAATVG